MKVLISYVNNEKIDQLFTRIEKVNKSKSFDALICFGNTDLSNEESTYLLSDNDLPIDTYIIGCILSDKKHPNNLHILNNFGNTTIGSLSVTYYIDTNDYINTNLKQEIDDENYLSLVSDCSNKQSPSDILITNYWPENILNNININNYPSDLKESKMSMCGSSKVRRLNEICTPRYHFTSAIRSGFELPNDKSQIYYERFPFKHQTMNHVCRFISLPNIGTIKQKWLYASNIQPLATITNDKVSIPVGCTDSPFIISNEPQKKKQKITSNINSAYNVFLPNTNEDNNNNKNNYKNQNNRKKRTMGSCWFCIDGDKVEDHLITSIGDECYLALPKGGLTKNHVLIIPLDHITNPFEMTKETINEINLYKKKLQQFAESQDYNMIFFERNVETQFGMVHCMIQCIPVPKTISIEDIKLKFEEIGKQKYDITFSVLKEDESIKNIVGNDGKYFLLELANKIRLLHVVSQKKHPLQFGREVLAEILGIQNRVNWKSCVENKQKEIEQANNFKKLFKQYELQ